MIAPYQAAKLHALIEQVVAANGVSFLQAARSELDAYILGLIDVPSQSDLTLTNKQKDKAYDYACIVYADDNDIEIDNNPQFSESETGAWVSAWLFVPKERYK